VCFHSPITEAIFCVFSSPYIEHNPATVKGHAYRHMTS
jgi:hypothetical protein